MLQPYTQWVCSKSGQWTGVGKVDLCNNFWFLQWIIILIIHLFTRHILVPGTCSVDLYLGSPFCKAYKLAKVSLPLDGFDWVQCLSSTYHCGQENAIHWFFGSQVLCLTPETWWSPTQLKERRGRFPNKNWYCLPKR